MNTPMPLSYQPMLESEFNEHVSARKKGYAASVISGMFDMCDNTLMRITMPPLAIGMVMVVLIEYAV